MRSDSTNDCRAQLIAGRNTDGGWGYGPGKRSRIEPTCWALLALAHADALAPDPDVLRRWDRRDGWLIDLAGPPPNHAFNAVAALTLLRSPMDEARVAPIVDRLIASKGLRLPTVPAVRQDGSLRAWSWIDGTASWVEPTAWCLLLLKQWRLRHASSVADERIDVGERMLFDRVCRAGGWNYGNSRVYGHDLWPYVPTTALALLALQDRPDHSIVRQSLDQLRRDVLNERSVVALALTLICLRVFALPAEDVEESLVVTLRHSQANGTLADNVVAQAMALYALTSSRPPAAFMVNS